MKSASLWMCIAFAALALVEGQDVATAAAEPKADKSLRGPEQGRRRTFSFLTMLFSIGPHPRCILPHEREHNSDCHHHHHHPSGGGGSSTNSGGGGGGGSGGSGGGGSGGSGGSGGGSGSYNSGGGGSGSYSAISDGSYDYSNGGGDGGGSGSGGSSEAYAQQGPSSNRASASLAGIANQSLAGIMGVVAMVALATAMAAMVVGQRKESKKKHPLEGCVQKRMGLFSSFVERHAAATEGRAEPRVVEMSAREGDYQLA